MGEQLDFEAGLRRIRQSFLTRLAENLAEFEAFGAALARREIPAERVQDIRMSLHKLAGSARTFGFPELNGDAALAEGWLDQLIDGVPAEKILGDLTSAFDAFLIRARRIVADAEATAVAPAEMPDPGDEAVEDFDYTILVADDDSLVRDLLRHSLEGTKIRIRQAETGDEVLAMLQGAGADPGAGRIDLIVLDVNMPGRNGFDVLAVLKTDPALRDVPVIMLTRRDEDENVIRGISFGALDYITKPFQVPELVNRITTALKHNSTRILIADDDPLITAMLSQRFSRMGYKVRLAANGRKALACLQTERPDVAILDVMMPAMDGLAVLKLCKADAETADIPIIILTAKNQRENLLQGLDSGADDYMTKPFDLDEVAARVSGILRRKKIA